ncbi:MAG: tetratricopeptide repeat protein [bacterium]|nr:tetratricopeptide repeat protein [bacterium]
MDFSERGEYLRKAVSILVELSAAHPNTPNYRHLLARCYRELRSDQSDPFVEPTSDPAARAVEILEQLVGDYPGVPEYRFDLSETYASLDRPRTPGAADSQNVERHMRAALRIMEELAAERPNVPDYVLSLARMYHQLDNVLRRAGRREEAEKSVRRAVTLQSSLTRRFPEVGPYAVGQALYQISLAELLFRQGRFKETRELLESSVTILEGKACQELEQGYILDLSERGNRLLSDVLRCLDERGLADDAAERANESRRSRRDWRGLP